ncbi:MAG: peroxiredoxin family protein [Trebonia sp.]
MTRISRPPARKRNRWLAWGALVSAVVAVAGVVTGLHLAGSSPGKPPAAGAAAPDGTFTTEHGSTTDIATLRGHPTLLWFVTTWCSSCQYGTHVMAQNIGKLRALGVRVEEVELYADLGQQGTPIGRFATVLAGTQASNPDWSFGTSSAGLTGTYDPKGYLDIYYLLNAHGTITYVNSSPGATMPQLIAAARKLA